MAVNSARSPRSSAGNLFVFVVVLVGRSVPIGVSQLLYYAVEFLDMISDKKIHPFGCTSSFIYFIIRIDVLKTNTQSSASAVSIKIRDTNNYIECPFSTGSRIENLRQNCTTLTENVSECEWKLERER